jgi:hypothetical protein
MSQVVKVARRLRDSLQRQRPDFQESGQNEEEDLTREDAEWMTQISPKPQNPSFSYVMMNY